MVNSMFKQDIIYMRTSILHLSDQIRFVGIMDKEGKVLSSAFKYKQYEIGKENESFELDVNIIRNIQEVYDESLGKVRTMIITRERITQIILYFDSKLIFISCNPRINDKSLQELINSIENYYKNNFE